jgi:hypothetical protein
MGRDFRLLVLLPIFVLTGCFGNTGAFPAAQDAQLIVRSVTPIAKSVDAAPATQAVIARNLAAITSESAALSHQFAPNLLDVQQFYGAAQDLLAALGAVPNLPPQAVGVIDAATALLPTFPAVDGSPPPRGPFKMSAEQARVLLGGSAPVAVPAPESRPEPVAVLASPPPASRFHISIDDLGSGFGYQFSDRGQVIDQGEAPTLRVVETRFEAFKRQRNLAP